MLTNTNEDILPIGTAVTCDDGIKRYVTLREHAIEDGLQFFFTGIECKNKHMCERRVADSLCVECIKNNSQ